MAPDISKNVVAVLLVLTIVVSAVGTYAVVTDTPEVPELGPGSAEVSLDIVPGPSEATVSVQITEPPTEA